MQRPVTAKASASVVNEGLVWTAVQEVWRAHLITISDRDVRRSTASCGHGATVSSVTVAEVACETPK